MPRPVLALIAIAIVIALVVGVMWWHASDTSPVEKKVAASGGASAGAATLGDYINAQIDKGGYGV